LQDNTDLSRRRAEAVKAHLVEKSGVDETRIEVAGVGYLVPVASNLTAEGREANRRVEAVLLPRPKP
jgi:OOP family OmpA-OmpF porin